MEQSHTQWPVHTSTNVSLSAHLSATADLRPQAIGEEVICRRPLQRSVWKYDSNDGSNDEAGRSWRLRE